MNNPYKYSGKRLKMSMARELIIEFFKGKTAHKQEIIRRVDEIHLEGGGKQSDNIIHPVTDALNAMKRKGLANNPNPGDGIWEIYGQADDEGVDDDTDNSGDEVRKIGSGNNSVYVYYYPTYKHHAELQGEETWPCKIGSSEYSNPIHRVLQQAGTGMPEKPKIALVIQTHRPTDLENAMHTLLERDRMSDAPGTEWFMTNPSKIEDIYKIINQDYS
jgi:hypothetical protein